MNKSLLLDKSMPYKTEQLAMTNVIFQSMVNHLGNRIRRMNFQLHFNTESEKTAFISSMQRQKQREENQIEIDASDKEDNTQSYSSEYIRPNNSSQLDTIVIEETFEKSILLREKFMDQLREIGKRLNVTFTVVPNKVKISGVIRDRVEEAQDQYREIQQDICFEPIDKYGREVYQSKFFKGYLKQKKVQVIQILRKYYFWFKKSQTEPFDIIRQVFMTTAHVLYPIYRVRKNQKEAITSGKCFLALGEIDFEKREQKTSDKLYLGVKARIFEEFLSKKLNVLQDRKERHIQLSEDRRALILHMDAEEQIQIQRCSIDQEYNRYKYLILKFNEKIEMSKVAQFFASTKFKVVIAYEIMETCVCLGFVAPIISEQTLMDHPLIQTINELPKQLLDFKLGLYDAFDVPQELQWNFMIVERDRIQKVVWVGVKSMLKKNVEKMVILYIQNKLSSEYLEKAKQQKLNTTSSKADVSISMDMTKPINESTQFLVNEVDHTMVKDKASESLQNSQILTGELAQSINFRFDNYNIFLKENEGDKNKKYSQDIDKIEKGKIPWKNEDYEKIMFISTTFKYKFFKVKIPKKYYQNMQKQVDQILKEKPELSHLNIWITVFAHDMKNHLYQVDQKVKIIKIQKNYKIKEGYLLNTNALFIYVSQNQELPMGRYEAISFIRKME